MFSWGNYSFIIWLLHLSICGMYWSWVYCREVINDTDVILFLLHFSPSLCNSHKQATFSDLKQAPWENFLRWFLFELHSSVGSYGLYRPLERRFLCEKWISHIHPSIALWFRQASIALAWEFCWYFVYLLAAQEGGGREGRVIYFPSNWMRMTKMQMTV